MNIPIWGRPGLESSLPHEIVNQDGERVPLCFYKSRAAATRELHRRQKLYDNRRRNRLSDPRGWRVQPVRAD